MSEPRFFKHVKEFQSWLAKNHARVFELWVGFHKAGLKTPGLSATQALEEAMTYGWTSVVIRSIDHATFQMKFIPRKPGGVWSLKNLQKYQELLKAKRIKPAGKKAFELRDQKRSEKKSPALSPQYLKRFKANSRAWKFFESQTPSYRKYMVQWIMSAKREETREARLSQLLEDSANGTKLKRILEAQAKYTASKSKPGHTPIEVAKNIGLITGTELRSLGIETLEQLQALGWEKAYLKWIDSFPERINRNALHALIGAVEGQSWKKLDSELKLQAARLLRELTRF